ncbi:MAG: DNA alkylation repair protein [Bacteroidota bacterium]|nr:DNA alkylation repair protein [Bacteroidota bacterium]
MGKVLEKLRAKADPSRLEGMAKFGMNTKNRLGVSMPDIRRVAKETGRDHTLALELWKTGIAEARIAASLIADPEKLTIREMESWVGDFDSWDVCDQVCMNLFRKSPLSARKIMEWSRREEEFVKRAAFALIACLAHYAEGARDEEFLEYLPIIERCADDGRNFVKKAVNWALRGIGKRNAALNAAAIRTAEAMRTSGSRSARWIAADALRELQSDGIQKRFTA